MEKRRAEDLQFIQRSGEWEKEYRTTKVGCESEDTGRAVLDPRVPEFISAIPLPLENPK